MNRRLKDFFSVNAWKKLRYVPAVVWRIKNWPSFLANYAGIAHTIPAYVFRNGLRITTVSPADVATIMVIFFYKDYEKAPDNSVVIDIGGNIGLYALFVSTASRGVTVYSYEPEPGNYEALTKNIRDNGLEGKIIPFRAAVGEATQKRKLYIEEGPWHSFLDKNIRKGSIDVDCLSLADVISKAGGRCDLLKIDCEGAEFEILYSAPENMFENIGDINLEYHVPPGSKNSREELIRFLEAKGYKVMRHSSVGTTIGNLFLAKSGR